MRVRAAAGLIAAAAAASPVGDSYLSAAHQSVADDAAAAVLDRRGAFKGTMDRDMSDKLLKHGMGWENYALRILRRADSREDVLRTIWEDASWPEARLVWDKAAGLALFAVMLLIVPFCTPKRCRRCRRNEKERSSGRCFKMVTTAAALVACAGLGGCGVFGYLAYTTLGNGFDNLSCASAQILDSSLSGHQDPSFVGLPRTSGELGAVAARLQEGSNFTGDLDGALRGSQEVARAVAVAEGALQLLSDAMTQNARPTDASGSLMHSCVLCDAVSAALPALESELRSSPAKALADARAEVAARLGEPARAGLRAALQDSSEPASNVTELLVDSLGWLVESEGHDQAEAIIHRDLKWTLLGFAAVCALTVLFALGAHLAFAVGEHGRRKSVPGHVLEDPEDPTGAAFENPYSLCVHRAASCAWVCSCCTALPLLLLGGCLSLAAVPLSGGCVLLQDISSDLLRDVAPALEISVANVVEKCFRPGAAASGADLFEVLAAAENGTEKPLRERLVTELTEPLTWVFGNLTDALATSSSLAAAPGAAQLDVLLSDSPVDALLLPDVVALQARADFAGAPADWLGYTTSASCASFTPSGVAGAPSQAAGIRALCQSQEDAGVPVGFAPCNVSGPEPVGSARPCAGGQAQGLCEAGNALLELKERLLVSASFRCDLFEDPGLPGATCDIGGMSQANAVWSGDCLSAEGSLRQSRRSCTLEEFTAYTRDFALRLRRALERVDQAVGAVSDEVNATLRALVDSGVVAPIGEVADGSQCAFLSEYYSSAVDGMCLQGVVAIQVIAIACVVSGLLLACLTTLMYVLWRRALDNVRAKATEIERRKTGEIVI